MVKLGYVITYVNDIEVAVLFFERAFGFKKKFIDESKTYAEMATGETIIGFANHSLGKENLVEGYVDAGKSKLPLGMELGLTCDDLEMTHKKAIECGAVEISPPIKKSWGQIVSYLRCPSGILLELGDEIQASKT